MNSGVKIIAEVGVNHNGDLEEARRLIGISKSAGADAVKFQFFNARSLAHPSAGLAKYQKASVGSDGKQLAMLEMLELGLDNFVKLEAEARETGIGFMLSVFDALAVDQILNSFDLQALKIPSGEIENEKLIRAAANSGLDVIISTGMAEMSEVLRATQWFDDESNSQNRLSLMHCTSNYPTASKDLNIRAIAGMREEVGLPVGLSDHSQGSLGAILAVALGANAIEKHITRDKAHPGPDHKASEDPETFRKYVSDIREACLALGDGAKIARESEHEVRALVRRSPYATKAIEAGHKFSESNVALFRPVANVPASSFTNLLGRAAKRAYEPGQPIRLEELGER